MSLSLSPQIRLVALIGLAAALTTGVGSFLLLRAPADPVPAATASVLPSPAQAAAAASPGKPAPPAPAAKAPAPAAPSAKGPVPAAKPAPKPKPEPKPTVAPNGFPLALHAALQRHDVVVVSLHTPGGRVDELALPEARAGAEAARAGFVALNALDELQGGALARLIGIRKTPALFVYTNPDVLALTIDGYVDAETVAQAAQNARP